MTIAAILVLAGGTYAYRIAGPLLSSRLRRWGQAPVKGSAKTLSDRVSRLLLIGAAVLLLALVSTSALTQGHGFAGWARPAGVALGAVLAIRRAPFIVVVIAAATTTALLRLAGVP